MKNYAGIFFFLFFLSCSSSKKIIAKTESEKTGQWKIGEGQVLITQNDCVTCHKLNDKLIAPSFTAISNKYENDSTAISMLTDKIIKGGKGNWGDLPMIPHPSMNNEDAIIIVKYILSLKK